MILASIFKIVHLRNNFSFWKLNIYIKLSSRYYAFFYVLSLFYDIMIFNMFFSFIMVFRSTGRYAERNRFRHFLHSRGEKLSSHRK